MSIADELIGYGFTPDVYESVLNACDDKIHGISDDDWQDIVDKFDLDISRESLRKAQRLALFGGNFVKRYYEEKMSDLGVADEANSETKNVLKAKKERAKTQAEKIELNKWLRESARDELITDKIVNAVRGLDKLKVPDPIFRIEEIAEDKKRPTRYALFFGDAHFGVEYELRDIHNRVINAYSPDIFYQRMTDLLDKTITFCQDNNVQILDVVDIGDNIDGIIRLTSQLMKLRYGVVDSSVKYANFMAKWINELSKHVYVKYHMVLDGNHSQLRMCGAPKNAFPEDNMSKVIQEIIECRLEDNPNVEIVKNPTGMVYFKLCNYPILAIHGEVKDMKKAINEYSRVYEIPISYLIAGHYHSSKSEELYSCCSVINIPSIIGTDSYALSLRKKSNAGAMLLGFKDNEGKVFEYDIKLSNVKNIG